MKKGFCSIIFLMVSLVMPAYEVIVFGDVHFDAEEVRDPSVKRPAYQEKEKKRNLENWKKNIPDMLDRSAEKVNKETAFVVQLGDIVQGDCGSQKLHEASLRTVLPMFKKRFPDLRFLWVAGNHDIRGKGAPAACRNEMIPYLSQTLKETLPPKSPVQYAFMQDKDLYIALDSNNPDIKFLEKALAAHPERRYCFIMTHFPIIPSSPGNAAWVIGGRPDKPELRTKLIELLAKNHAIVLCAHIHCATLTKWQNDAGSITQFTFFSIFPENPAPAEQKDRDLKKPFLSIMNAKESKDKQQKMGVLKDYLSCYKELKDIQPGAGFAVLKPDDKGVSLELFYTTSAKPTHTLKLK